METVKNSMSSLLERSDSMSSLLLVDKVEGPDVPPSTWYNLPMELHAGPSDVGALSEGRFRSWLMCLSLYTTYHRNYTSRFGECE